MRGWWISQLSLGAVENRKSATSQRAVVSEDRSLNEFAALKIQVVVMF
jgi:hypothetical protein